jgi:hypothetical protein
LQADDDDDDEMMPKEQSNKGMEWLKNKIASLCLCLFSVIKHNKIKNKFQYLHSLIFVFKQNSLFFFFFFTV